MNKYFLNLFFKLACILLLSSKCLAQTYLVSSLEEVNQIIDTVKAGTTIVLKNGIYSGKIDFVNNNGLFNSPITLQAQTPNGVILTDRSWIQMTGHYLNLKDFVFYKTQNPNNSGQPSNLIVYLNGASNSRVSNCAFIECGDPNTANGTIVYLANGSYQNKIDYCFFTRSHSISVKVEVNETQGANNHHNIIEYNYFKDIEDWPLNVIVPAGCLSENKKWCFNGGEPIAIGTGEGWWKEIYTIVQYNLFENAILDNEIISNKSSNNTIRYNTLRNNHAHWDDPDNNRNAHLSIRGGNHCEVYGNFILDTDYGIVLHGSGHQVYNNYIKNAGIGLLMKGGNSDYSNLTNSTIANNSIVNSTDQGFLFGSSDFTYPYSNKLYNNIIYSEVGTSHAIQGIFEAGSLSLNDWQSNIIYGGFPGNISNAGITQGNPSFLQQGTLYRIQSTSDMINAGYPVANITEDMDGQSRIGNIDIGADEYSASAIVRQPLQPTDVGPVWITDYSSYIIGNLNPTIMAQKIVKGDFDNDCREDDIASIYNYNGQTAIHLFKSNGSKFRYEPFWWDFPTGSGNPISWFNFNNIKYVTSGDYDNDSFKDDIAIFYDEDGKTTIHMVLSNGTKFIYQPFWWSDPPGSYNSIAWFNPNNIKYVVSGSFDADQHADDIAIFYDENGKTAVHMLKSDSTKFMYQSFWWGDPPLSNNPITWFSLNNIKYIVSGDFDGQGKDDIAMLYDENGSTAIHMIKSDGTKFIYKSFWWADTPGSNSPISWFNLNNIKKVVSGSFDNQGKDDIAMFYNEDGKTAVHMLKSNGTDFIYDSFWWADPPGSNNAIPWFNLNNIISVTSADFDGDTKRNDLAIMYNENGNPAIHMLNSNNSDLLYSSFWWNFSTFVNPTNCPDCCGFNEARINSTNSTGVLTSMEESHSNDLQVFPNPSSNVFHVNGLNISDYSFHLYDLTGRSIKIRISKEGETEVKIQCEDIPSGIYLLKAFSLKKNFYRRVIIEE